MSAEFDFLAMSCHQADAALLQWRQVVTDSLPPGLKIDDDSAVVLVALDGAGEHRQFHPEYYPCHYAEFSECCRRFLRDYGGISVGAEQAGPVTHLACAWFPRQKAGIALAGCAAIHHYLRNRNELYRPKWMHEWRALAAVGTSEYAAFRLLQMAKRDLTVVEPRLFEAEVSEEVRWFGRAIDIAPPDRAQRRKEIDELLDRNVEQFRRTVAKHARERANLEEGLAEPLPVG
jgi:hypothetical protein